MRLWYNLRMRRKVFALGLTFLMAACVPQASVGPPAGATALPTADVVAVATDQTAGPSLTAGATALATSTAPASEPPEIGPVEGFNDGIVLATADAALVVVYPGTGQVVTLVGPGNYAVDGDNHLIPFLWPVRFSPDGQWAIVPTPAGGTWLAGINGESRQIHAQRLTATWSPLPTSTFAMDAAFFARFYAGFDYYNMNFDRTIKRLDFGLLFLPGM